MNAQFIAGLNGYRVTIYNDGKEIDSKFFPIKSVGSIKLAVEKAYSDAKAYAKTFNCE